MLEVDPKCKVFSVERTKIYKENRTNKLKR